MPTFELDGNWVDMATLGVAFFYALGRRLVSQQGASLEAFVSDISYGVSIFPMALLTLTVVSSTALTALLTGNKVIISLAGLFSLIVILKRSFDRPQGRPRYLA